MDGEGGSSVCPAPSVHAKGVECMQAGWGAAWVERQMEGDGWAPFPPHLRKGWGRARVQQVAHKPGGGGAAQAEGPACEQKGRGDALSTLPPACMQRRWRACSWSGVQPGQRGLLPANGKEGGWSIGPSLVNKCHSLIGNDKY